MRLLPQVRTACQRVAEALTILAQGEAVAFVLGAGNAVLRTKKGAALINASLQLHSGAAAEAKASLESPHSKSHAFLVYAKYYHPNP